MRHSYNLHLRFIEAGLTIPEAADLCGVTAQTFKLWGKGRIKTPAYPYKILKTYGAGHLPCSGKDWDGWRFRAGLLWLPEGITYGSGEIRAIHFLRQ